jgi:hypothetical protein
VCVCGYVGGWGVQFSALCACLYVCTSKRNRDPKRETHSHTHGERERAREREMERKRERDIDRRERERERERVEYYVSSTAVVHMQYWRRKWYVACE